MSKRGQWGLLVVVIIIAFFIALYNAFSSILQIIHTSKNLAILLASERDVSFIERIYLDKEFELAEKQTLNHMMSSWDLGKGYYNNIPICNIPDKNSFEEEWKKSFASYLAMIVTKNSNKYLKVSVFNFDFEDKTYEGKLKFYIDEKNLKYEETLEFSYTSKYDLDSVYSYYENLYNKYLKEKRDLESCLSSKNLYECCRDLELECYFGEKIGFLVKLDTEYGEYKCVGVIET